MGLLLEVLQIVAPVFALAGIGYGWVRLGMDYPVEFVTRLAMSLAVPCLIFSALVKTEIDLSILRDTALASLLAYSAVGIAVIAATRLFSLEPRTFWAPVTFGNTGNLGLPVALFAFGAEGLGLAVVIFAVMAILSFTLGVWVVSGGGSLLTAVREPLVAATVLGGICLVMDWSPPLWAMNSLDLVGQMAIPMMLITLGVAISRLVPAAILRATVISLTKFALCLAAALWAGRIVGLSDLAVGVLVLQLTTPVAVTSYMLAEKYNADAGEVAGLVVVSTLFSVLSIPLTLAFFI